LRGSHDGKAHEDGESQQSEIRHKCRAGKENEEVFQRVSGFGNDSENGDENCTPCNEEGTKDHPERKYISEDETGEESIPQQ